MNYEDLLDFSKIQHRIVYRLMNAEENEELLKQIPHLPIMDLAITFHVLIPTKKYDSCSMPIKQEHINLWKVPISRLYELAKQNTPRLCPCRFLRLSEYIQLPEIELGYSNPLRVLTNEMGIYGAAVLLYPEIPKKIYEKISGGYYLLPSSVHEFLVLPMDCCSYDRDLHQIVQEVNTSCVEKHEFLSNNVYCFDGENITKV